MSQSKDRNLKPARYAAEAACAHARIVDDELSENREKTGRLICKECGGVFLNENKTS